MQMSLRDVGSFGQSGEVEEGPAHPQTDEEELRDELWEKRQKDVNGRSSIFWLSSHRTASVCNGYQWELASCIVLKG